MFYLFSHKREQQLTHIFLHSQECNSNGIRRTQQKEAISITYMMYTNIFHYYYFFFQTQVSGCDVRNATHDEAVEAIRNSPDLITFVVQSLSYSPCVSTTLSIMHTFKPEIFVPLNYWYTSRFSFANSNNPSSMLFNIFCFIILFYLLFWNVFTARMYFYRSIISPQWWQFMAYKNVNNILITFLCGNVR